MTDGAIDLQVPDLATLQQRRSEKWSGHEPDVLGVDSRRNGLPSSS